MADRHQGLRCSSEEETDWCSHALPPLRYTHQLAALQEGKDPSPSQLPAEGGGLIDGGGM